MKLKKSSGNNQAFRTSLAICFLDFSSLLCEMRQPLSLSAPGLLLRNFFCEPWSSRFYTGPVCTTVLWLTNSFLHMIEWRNRRWERFAAFLKSQSKHLKSYLVAKWLLLTAYQISTRHTILPLKHPTNCSTRSISSDPDCPTHPLNSFSLLTFPAFNSFLPATVTFTHGFPSSRSLCTSTPSYLTCFHSPSLPTFLWLVSGLLLSWIPEYFSLRI